MFKILLAIVWTCVLPFLESVHACAPFNNRDFPSLFFLFLFSISNLTVMVGLMVHYRYIFLQVGPISGHSPPPPTGKRSDC